MDLHFVLFEEIDDGMNPVLDFFVDFRHEDPDDILIDGRDAIRLRYSHRMEGTKLRVAAYFLVKGRRGFVLTSTALADTFSRYKRTFESIARSFRLR